MTRLLGLAEKGHIAKIKHKLPFQQIAKKLLKSYYKIEYLFIELINYLNRYFS